MTTFVLLMGAFKRFSVENPQLWEDISEDLA